MPAVLPDELLEEIFRHLPPDEPEWLVRASLASKLWLGLLSGPSFRCRYREFYGAPPMLGFLYSSDSIPTQNPRFIPTTKFRPRIPDGGWRAWRYAAPDYRHGRALLRANDVLPGQLIVSDPLTGYMSEFDKPREYTMNHYYYRAAVLCAARGCDHRACRHEGPFLVVFIGLVESHGSSFARTYVFSSETGEWSEPCSNLDLGAEATLESLTPVLVEDALYFMFAYEGVENIRIIKYDLGSNCLSLIDVPVEGYVSVGATILMAMDDASLGFAFVDGLTLYLWSRQMGFDRVASWTKRGVVNLENLLPVHNSMERISLNGSVEGRDIIFVTTIFGVYYEINLKSLQWKKLWKKGEHFHSLIPYMSFYNPQERVKGETLRCGTLTMHG